MEQEESFEDLVKMAIRLVKSLRDNKKQRPKDGSEKRLMRYAKTLAIANDNDSMAIQGALFSAWGEFHLLLKDKEKVQTDDSNQVTELLRIASNRAKRAERKNLRIRAEASRGEEGPDNIRPLQQFFEKLSGFRAHLRLLIGELYSGLNSDEKAIFLHLAKGRTQNEIAQMLCCHRSKISRIKDRISDRLDDILSREN